MTALVQYSDSESEEETPSAQSPPRPAKKRRQDSAATSSSLPPLPRAFHDLYAANTRVSVRDDPSLHGGRKRVIPHIEGNWPTHLYLEWHPSREELVILEEVTAQISQILSQEDVQVHSLLRSDLGVQLPLHISLSRPVVLRTEQRHSFLQLLQTHLHESDIPRFDAATEGLHCVSNYEKTRWFFVLRVKRPESDALNRLLRVSNRSLAYFGQPPLYEHRSPGSFQNSKPKDLQQQQGQASHPNSLEDYSDSFHISIAWSLTEPSREQKEQVARLDLQNLDKLSICFDCVKAKIGNNITSIPLSARLVD